MELEEYRKLVKMQDEHWWFLGRKKIIKKILDSIGVYNVRILDIGGGMGGNVNILKNYGEVTVIDKETVAIEQLKNIKSINILEGYFPDDFKNIELDYKLVTMFDVLEHLRDDKYVLKFLYRKLPTQSTLVITVPAYQFMFSKHDENCHHYRRYTLSKLKECLEGSGFELIYVSYFNSLLFPLALISRFVTKIRGKTTTLELEPNKNINKVLLNLFSIESKLIPKLSLLFGLSIIAVCKKKE